MQSSLIKNLFISLLYKNKLASQDKHWLLLGRPLYNILVPSVSVVRIICQQNPPNITFLVSSQSSKYTLVAETVLPTSSVTLPLYFFKQVGLVSDKDINLSISFSLLSISILESTSISVLHIA